jgi:hypothetical protein
MEENIPNTDLVPNKIVEEDIPFQHVNNPAADIKPVIKKYLGVPNHAEQKANKFFFSDGDATVEITVVTTVFFWTNSLMPYPNWSIKPSNLNCWKMSLNIAFQQKQSTAISAKKTFLSPFPTILTISPALMPCRCTGRKI